MAIKTKEVLTIDTGLINKREVFRMLALAHSTGLPLLLVGDPGTGKTAIVMDYAKSYLMANIDTSDPEQMKQAEEDFVNRVFLLETDEGTKASDVKGMPDIEKLYKENKYELLTPIAHADIVIINEVDKASSAIRNSLLGVMNEKFIFTGKQKIPCRWKLFIATCNEIPKEEKGSPFWDRFILKTDVNRVDAGQLVNYFQHGGKKYHDTFNISLPDSDELEQVVVPIKKLERYLDVGYTLCSDRTLTFLPTLTRAVSLIWDYSINKALVKVADIMLGQTYGSKLKEKLNTQEVKALLSKIDMTYSINNSEAISAHVSEIEILMKGYAAQGKLDEDEVDELQTTLDAVLNNHPIKKRGEEIEDMLSKALSSSGPAVNSNTLQAAIYNK